MGNYRRLSVWKKSIQLVRAVYEATRRFPKDEIYGLSAQMRRAAVSIPSNVAEGQGRSSRNDFRHFIRQARGSLLELETQIFISEELHFISAGCGESLRMQTQEIGKMLNGLIRYLMSDV